MRKQKLENGMLPGVFRSHAQQNSDVQRAPGKAEKEMPEQPDSKDGWDQLVLYFNGFENYSIGCGVFNCGKLLISLGS